MINRQVLLVNRPGGITQAADFQIVERSIEQLPDAAIRVANRFLSIDPAMRGWIADVGNYA